MDILKKFDPKTSTILKISGVALVVIIVIAIAFRLIGSSLNSMFTKSGISNIFPSSAPSYDVAESYGNKATVGSGTVGLSARNVASSQGSILPYDNGGTTGSDAEQFEVTEYSAYIETRVLKNICSSIAGLKAKDYVIFENASEYDRGCNYTFKVKKDNVAEILSLIKKLNPKELSENTYTIKKLVEDFTSEVEILQKKLASIDDTLKKAVAAYDEVTDLATKVKDVESLAKIIDSKINIIERLTQERINANAQLEAIQRAKAVQLDRLEYTYFRVNVIENKFIDATIIKDSWRAAIKEFVSDVNKIAQDITINLFAFLFYILQYAIYILILIFIAKYGWVLVKRIWKQ